MPKYCKQSLLKQMTLTACTLNRIVLIRGWPVQRPYIACWSNTSGKPIPYHHVNSYSRKTICGSKIATSERKLNNTWLVKLLLRFFIALPREAWSKVMWLLRHQTWSAPGQRIIMFMMSRIPCEWQSKRIMPGMKCLKKLVRLEIHQSRLDLHHHY